MAEKLKELQFSSEIKKSFLDYAMSVIVQRALPDVKDGLKPVQRRIIYGINQIGATAGSPHKKCAKIVGEIMGNYHPHGDSSIYSALVRMAQYFSYRYPLIDGRGNFGSLDGDEAAAQRYTEARMSKLSMELVRDINKNSVDFVPNYDGEELEPVVLPARFPNLLVNGSTGIAVGMATNIPPHNLGEIIDGTIALIDNKDISILELMQYIKGPDFPTGATILGNQGIKKAYETGRGSITIRSRAEIIEKSNGKSQIIVTEIPYMVNKASLVNSIANLVKNKTIDGVTDLRDESNRGTIKIVIELRRDVNANVILNNLYKHTELQQNYGVNMLALVDNEPKLLNIKQILEKYIEHQILVITKRTQFDLEKASAREHILEGLKIALDNIDAVVNIIRNSKTDDESIEKLQNNFKLSEIQARSILEMKMKRLTGLEREKLDEELQELIILIADLKDILEKEERILNIIKEELLEIKNKYNDERKTNIDMTAIDYIEDESLIPEEDIIITLTHNGYIKRVNNDTYKVQNRGGVGIKGISVNDEDYTEKLISMKSHDYLLLFSNLGIVYRLKGYEIPEYSRQSKGLPIINLLPLSKDEKITSLLNISGKDEKSKYIVFITEKAFVKRTLISEFENIRSNGKIAISLKENDKLIAVKKSSGLDYIIIASKNGKLVKFKEEEVRSTGRTASGCKGMNLDNSIVVGSEVIEDSNELLILTENGYGKKTKVEDFRITKRGAKGVKALNTTEKTGNLISVKYPQDDEDILLITDQGTVIKLSQEQISVIGRNTQGIKLINLKNESKVSSVALTPKENLEESSEEHIEN